QRAEWALADLVVEVSELLVDRGELLLDEQLLLLRPRDQPRVTAGADQEPDGAEPLPGDRGPVEVRHADVVLLPGLLQRDLAPAPVMLLDHLGDRQHRRDD